MMEIMYRVPTKTGTQTYGSEYKVITQTRSLRRISQDCFGQSHSSFSSVSLVSQAHLSSLFLNIIIFLSLISQSHFIGLIVRCLSRLSDLFLSLLSALFVSFSAHSHFVVSAVSPVLSAYTYASLIRQFILSLSRFNLSLRPTPENARTHSVASLERRQAS